MLRKARKVKGLKRFTNDLVCLHRPTSTKISVFFGGDVQNYQSDMLQAHPEYAAYSFEGTVELLGRKYPQSDIVLIRPDRMEDRTFSHFDSFTVFPGTGGEHLLSLLENGREKLNISANVDWTTMRLDLIGFSKGCSVLRSLLRGLVHSVEAMKEEKMETIHEKTLELFSRVDVLHWVDGGDAGFEPDPASLAPAFSFLNEKKVKIRIHGTPRQLLDESRPHIKEQHDEFVGALKEGEVDVVDRMYFGDEPASMDRHFDMLQEYDAAI